ncbi:hypothetical protein [Streptomyces nitrosporeus]|uniref:hypothetical protein n=1 Tax=Streptomyces nitrosporeus TaxID=28894 RepID=UPI00331F5EA7
MRIPNLMTWIKNPLLWILDHTTQVVRRRRLRAEVSRLALRSFYAALDEIDALEAKVEAEQKKRLDLLVESRVAAELRRPLTCAVAEFADAFDDEMLAIYEAPRLSDRQASALAWLLSAAGRPNAGEIWERLHESSNEPEDADSEDTEEVEAVTS